MDARPTPPHDPLVCGITYDGSCAECRQAWPALPPLSTGRRLWTWLCDRVPCLRRWRGTGEAATMPPINDEDRARLLALLCDVQVREAALAIFTPGIEAITDRRAAS